MSKTSCCQPPLKLPVPSLWPARHHRIWQASLCNIHTSVVFQKSVHTARSEGKDYRHYRQVHVSICWKNFLYYTNGNIYEPPQTRGRKSIWIPSDCTPETVFSFQYKHSEAKVLTPASLAKSHFEPLRLRELTRRSGWIIPMAPCTEECLETESKCGLGVFNYIRLNSNNLLHIL